jgi:cytochrome bd-type quinol oxidase subunit 2
MMNTLAICVVVQVVANLALTAWVVLSPALTTTQKVFQCLIVWLLPILGAVCVLLVHLTDAEPRRRKTPPPGDGSDPMPGGTQ